MRHPEPSSITTASTAVPRQSLTVPDYVRLLRPHLPPAARRSRSEAVPLLVLQLAILLLGWRMAGSLPRWPGLWALAFLPFALVMGNAVIVCLFATHELLHGPVSGRGWLRWPLGLLGLFLIWMPPTLWKAVHNREHHGQTNGVRDPDRGYLENQPDSWGKSLQHHFTPSDEVSPLGLGVGLVCAWLVYSVRTLCSVLLQPGATSTIPPAAFSMTAAERRVIVLELLVITALHGAVIGWIGLRPLPLLLGYFLPIWIGYAGSIAYIYTNHLLCPLTESNDPLVNTLSIRVPHWLDLLHMNFSHHVEHHIFPGLPCDYYPLVRELLLERFPDRFRPLGAAEAWRLLLTTPRHYRDGDTLVSADGRRQVPALRVPPDCGNG